jgi:hypothetical protein
MLSDVRSIGAMTVRLRSYNSATLPQIGIERTKVIKSISTLD